MCSNTFLNHCTKKVKGLSVNRYLIDKDYLFRGRVDPSFRESKICKKLAARRICKFATYYRRSAVNGQLRTGTN